MLLLLHFCFFNIQPGLGVFKRFQLFARLAVGVGSLVGLGRELGQQPEEHKLTELVTVLSGLFFFFFLIVSLALFKPFIWYKTDSKL